MHLKSFIPGYPVQIIIRVLLLSATSLLVAFTLVSRQGWFTVFNLGILLGIQIILLIYYLNRVNRIISNFFSSIREEGTSLIYSRKEKSLSRLFEKMDEINQLMSRLRESNLARSQYFHTVFEHVGVALLLFHEDGRVENINKACRQLFGIQHLTGIQKLASLEPGLPFILSGIRPGQQQLVRLKREHELVQLSVGATELIQGGARIKLVSLQNIGSELEEKELESWQKLIRVLTHEIMNSVAPISSSIETISGFFTDPRTARPADARLIDQNTVNNTLRGLEIIRDRSKGLLEFVRNYRKLTLLPKPDISEIPVGELINQIFILLNEKFDEHQVDFQQHVDPPGMVIEADRKLVEQVLINLLNNAMDALQKSGKKDKNISVRALNSKDNRKIIQVSDNGTGIPPDILDQIFIPFFSTREEGTGIGLSLSRQVMRLHQGSIQVETRQGEGTTFTLVF